MKYNAPPGGDTNAPYLDGNRNAGIKGSVVPAAAVEIPQRELVHLIGYAGLTPNNGDQEQVRKAIQALIAAATGGGDTSQFLLMSQARARLPIFPEVQSADGRINVISPAAGSVQVPTTVSFLHRGIFLANTSDYSEPNRTFNTFASKTYHLRWHPTNGFRLRDLADPTYNPGVLVESNPVFDSTYDDMLLSRVVTSAGNVAAITNLANRNVLTRQQFLSGTNGVNVGQNLANWRITDMFAWARTPTTYGLMPANVQVTASNQTLDFGMLNLAGNVVGAIDITRYGLDTRYLYDFTESAVRLVLFNARA